MSESVRTFGDVTGEYLAARAGIGFCTGVLGLVWVDGADAVAFLDGQLSQDVAAMEAGSVARALLLDPRGKLEAHLWVLRAQERVGLVVDAGVVEAVRDRLMAFMFRVDVHLSLDPRPAHELWGDAHGLVSTLSVHPGQRAWSDDGETLIAQLPGAAGGRVLVLGDPAGLLRGGGRPVGTVARDSVRIEAGEPVTGTDVDGSTIPQESGLVDAAVSFTKGCYVGQELVARIDSRGHVNRRLAGLTIATNVIPPAGSAVMVDGERRGTITSVGESLALRAPVALAMLRREVGAGDLVSVEWDGGTTPATVHDLPLDDFSTTSNTFLTRGAQDVDGPGEEEA